MNNWSAVFFKCSFVRLYSDRFISKRQTIVTPAKKKKINKIKNLPTNLTKFLILVFVFQQITCAGKCSVRQGVQSVALELHICEFRLRMSDTLAVVSPAAEISLLDGDTVLLEDATRVRDERGGTCTFGSRSTAQLLQRIIALSRLISLRNANVITCHVEFVKKNKKRRALLFQLRWRGPTRNLLTFNFDGSVDLRLNDRNIRIESLH